MKTIFLLLTVLATFVSYSQEKCAAHTQHKQRLANDPTYVAAMNVAQSKAKLWQEDHQNVEQKSTLMIPVVVHVLYKNANQNISMAQIQSQIDVLNEDYRALNQIVLPDYFDSLKADIGVEFCLASVDPNGNPTDGVTRTSTTGGSFFGYFSPFNDDIKYDSLGGKNCWPTDKYLNLWVGELFPGLLGYAQFPGDPKVNADGVAITTTAFGTTGNIDPISAGGRTATHEVGHWMGLYHIWGDEDACVGSDTIADTPNMAAASQQGCNSTANTCSNEDPFWGSFDPTDMVFNYMDYSSDTCMGMFTKGQRMRMHGFLNTDPRRLGLATSNGCAFMGIKEDLESMFTLSPNPAKNNVRILYNTGEIASVQIVNAQGQVVAVYDALTTGAELDLSNLEVGVYLVQMMKNEKMIGIERLVKH